MADGKCRFHGGKSTGPKTAEGLGRSQKANWQHGHYYRETKEKLKAMRQAMATVLNPKKAFEMTSSDIKNHTTILERLMEEMDFQERPQNS
ncbi:MAG: hypothetical protein K2X01_11775 [Cyanobacteria bacterium]|nr:hypothetical protein [Cyanobacteriota bacterium]